MKLNEHRDWSSISLKWSSGIPEDDRGHLVLATLGVASYYREIVDLSGVCITIAAQRFCDSAVSPVNRPTVRRLGGVHHDVIILSLPRKILVSAAKSYSLGATGLREPDLFSTPFFEGGLAYHSDDKAQERAVFTQAFQTHPGPARTEDALGALDLVKTLIWLQ